MTENEKSIIDCVIWCFESKEPTNYDVIMVLGNPTCVKLRLPDAIRLWEKQQEAQLVLCGGVVPQGEIHTEAEIMCDAALSAGVNPDRIILENSSTITRENIEFSAQIISQLALKNPKIVVISSPTHMRRVVMNLHRFYKLYPDGTVFTPLASSVQGLNKENWLNNEAIRIETATELRFIHEYLYELGYSQFDL